MGRYSPAVIDWGRTASGFDGGVGVVDEGGEGGWYGKNLIFRGNNINCASISSQNRHSSFFNRFGAGNIERKSFFFGRKRFPEKVRLWFPSRHTFPTALGNAI